MTTDKYVLSPETILNNKYHILMQIGKGGFSYIYLAECLSDGKLFAIKELFVEEYMERRIPETTVYLYKDSFKKRFETDLHHFQKEWIVMNEFKYHPGTVQPVDFFEENNTLYIVMEFLSGGSLKDHVRKNGKIKVDMLCKSLRNVFQLLSEMHAKGYVHGDISPDNLIMDGDNYKLIDFGAVRRTGEATSIEGQIRKEGYTPAEVFSRNNLTNQRSDIYSICATCYYAITGIEPEDALERGIIDELKPPSELYAEVHPLIEKTVMKGLSMIPDERWESIQKIQEQIDSYNKTEEQRKSEEESIKKKRRIRQLIAGAAIALTVLVGCRIFYFTHRELIKFKGQEIQKIVFFYKEETTHEESERVDNYIKEKIIDLAGENGYLFDKTDDYVEISIAYDLVENLNLSDFLNQYFNFSNYEIGYSDADGQFSTIKDFSSEDIVEYSTQDGKCIITINDSLSNKIGRRENKQQQLSLRIYTAGNGIHVWDKANIPNEGEYYDIPINYDSKDKNIIINDNTNNSINEGALLINSLYEERLQIGAFNYGRHIIWEQKQDTTWGKNQVNVTHFQDEYLLLSYINAFGDELNHNIFNIKVREKEIDNSTDVICIKKRLDTLNVPYACGWNKNNSNEIFIAIEPDGIWEIEAAILFGELTINTFTFESESISKGGTFYAKSTSGIALPYIDLSVPLEEKNDGIYLKFDDLNSLNKALQRILEKGDEKVQLCIGNRPVFQASLENISEDGYILFDEPLLDNLEDKNHSIEVKSFVDFLNSMIENHPSTYAYKFTGVQFMNSRGKEMWYRDLWSMHGCEGKRLRSYIQKYLSSRLGQSAEISWDMGIESTSVVNIKCNYDDLLKQEYTHPFAITKDLLDTIIWTNEITDIYFQLMDSDNLSRCYYINVDRSRINGKYHFRWSIDKWDDQEENYSEEDEKQLHLDKQAAASYMLTESLFFENYLEPALTNSFEETIEDDLLRMEISVQNTEKEQDYSIDYSVYNKTNEKINVTLKKVSINNCMPDFYYEDQLVVSPGGTGRQTTRVSVENFHYVQIEKMKNAILCFQISQGDRVIEKDVFIQRDNDGPNTKNTLNIPSGAKLVMDSSECSIYCLGHGWQNDRIEYINDSDKDWKHARFIFINKSSDHLIIDFTDLAFNNIWNKVDFFELIDILPFSSCSYDLDYDSPVILNPNTIRAKVSVRKKTLDSIYTELSSIEFEIEERQ